MSFRAVTTFEPLAVCEDENYKMALCQGNNQWHLYCVVVASERKAEFWPNYMVRSERTVYVLASNEEHAIGQSTCPDKKEDVVYVTCKQVPFRLRGWGKDEF